MNVHFWDQDEQLLYTRDFTDTLELAELLFQDSRPWYVTVDGQDYRVIEDYVDGLTEPLCPHDEEPFASKGPYDLHACADGVIMYWRGQRVIYLKAGV